MKVLIVKDNFVWPGYLPPSLHTKTSTDYIETE